ncbi:MAG TPA: ShlB/FhaC/HecB family hemolysin secretion/activation protein [Burkholderiales bacterium]|nr:ShlB/FhaC/HecB family hemolysin secretion/activation protein [Burkholderiales bacterium]
MGAEKGVLIAQAPAAGGAAVPPVSATPKIEEAKPAAPAAPAAPAQGGPKFEIRKFEVEDVTLLTPAQIDAALKPYTGPGRDFGDVQKALEVLEKLFLDQGYGSVQVLLPEQELEQGMVKFKVVEPKLAKVTVEGNKAFSEANIRRSLPALKEGTAPNSNRIASDLRLANENVAKGTTVLLRAGSNEGDVDAVVRVAEEKVTRFSVSLDNTGAGGSGSYRVGMGMQSSNVFGRDHVFSAQAITSPDERGHFQGYSRDVAIFGMQYHIPIYGLGDSMDFTAGYSNVNSGVVQNIFNVSGRGKVAGLRYTHNLPKWGGVEQKVVWAWDYRAYENNVTPVNGGLQIVPDITIHPMSLTYAATHRGQNDELNGFLSYNQNIPGGSDGDSAAFDASRPGGRPAYSLWRYGVTYLRSFAGDWQGRINVAGQYTRDRLVAGEQFGIGGAYSVRGFSERQYANDYGTFANFEIYTPEIASFFKLENTNKLRFLAFYDTGHVVRNQPLLNDTARTTASGAGLGLRFTHDNNLSVRLDAALATLPSNTGGDSTNGTATPTPTTLKQFRFHGAVIYLF